MRKLLIPASLLIAFSCPLVQANAEDAEWLTEEQMQNMSVTELQAWASKTEKSVKTSKTFAVKPQKSRTHMERRLGYHPRLAENSPELREEISADAPASADTAKTSSFPAPNYYDDHPEESNQGGIVNGVKKVVTSPLTGTTHMLHHTGKAIEKVLYFIDEKVPWI